MTKKDYKRFGNNPKSETKNLKKQIRDANRIKKNKGNNAQLTKHFDMKLSKLHFDLKMKKQLQKEELLKEKYKFVKFVELKKTLKKLKKITQKDSEYEHWNLNSFYIKYYPIDVKYIALYTESSQPNPIQEEIKEKIKEKMIQGLLVEGYVWRLYKLDFMGAIDDVSAVQEPKKEDDDFFI